MTDDFQTFLVAIGNDPDLAVVLNLEAGINDLAVDLTGQGGLGQARPDIRGHLPYADRLVVVALTAVGKSYRGHVSSFWSVVTPTKGHVLRMFVSIDSAHGSAALWHRPQ